jgi:outer membrane protein assembly factor BamB
MYLFPQRKLVLILLLSLTLSGCATFEHLKDATQNLGNSLFGDNTNSEPPAVLTDYKSELEINVLWKAQVGVGKNKQALKLNLAVADHRVYVADKQGLVQAREATTGQLLWEIEAQHPLSAGPGIGANAVILGGSDAQVLAVNKTDGSLLWMTRVSSEVLAVPVIAEGVVIIRTTDGEVVALDEKDGHRIWSVEETPPALMLRGLGTPVMVKNTVMLGFASGKLMALELHSGKNLWETTVAMPTGRSEVERLVDLAADPVSQEDLIYVSSYHGGLSALTAEGNVLWRNEHLSSATGVGSDGRYLYITDNDSDVWQVDPRTGGTLWKQAELHYRVLTAPVVYGEAVLVGDYEGYLHCLGRNDGRLLARIQLSSSALDSKPIVVDDTVYIYAKDGTLAALKAKVF